VVQSGSPSELYSRPATRYVAEFIGRANLLRGTVRTATAKELVIEVEGHRIATSPANVADGVSVEPNAEVSVVTRPEDLALATAAATPGTIALTVASTVYLGSHIDVVGVVGDEPRPFRVSIDKAAVVPSVGDTVDVNVPAAGIWV